MLGCVLSLAACGGKDKDNNEDDNKNPGGTIVGGNGGGTTVNGETEYTVQVVTVGGMPLEGVMVYIHKGDGYNICTMPQETDENGMVKFTLKTADDYSVQVDGVPQGYNVREGLTKDDRYPLSSQGTVIRLSSAPIKTGGFEDSYELGDVMYDFTLTDINGKEYKLSTLLETKDMVMLNFWYVGCSNCAYEFPYVNSVYEDYKDSIEILAINDYGDSLADIKGYNDMLHASANEGGWGQMTEDETLTIPLFKVGNGENDLTLSRFPSEGYPTTVIIDRYGVITMIEVGAVLGESKWQNIFDYFVGDDYKQVLIDNPEMLNPKIEPTVQWTDTSASEIAGAFNSGDITVNYYPETNGTDAKYAWPFIADTYNGEPVVRPSNNGVDNSFAILYAEVALKPGQAIMFDWLASTQNNAMGYDVLYILVDGKDIYSISGISENGFETCCTYVDPRPVTESNKDVVATYEVAFLYYKDNVESEGDDTVYLKNLRVVEATEIPVETYIFRYAATDLNETGDGYNTYVEVYLGADGYYHVGSADGPLLLANHLSYTQFDSEKTLSERVYGNEDYTFMVNGVNRFNDWLIYGNAASNSLIYYYTPVTEELKEMLVAYCDTYKGVVGKADHPDLWLQLCAYYDAYGTVDGVKTPHLPNPIIGLTSFSAYEMDVKDGNYEANEIIATAEVEYTKAIMPRGYLYKFVPKVSGVYRVTSNSIDKEVTGWIFVDGDKWAQEGDRILYTSSDVAVERFCTDLIKEVDGKLVRDNLNTSIAAYMEAGKEYFIDIAYYSNDDTGKFTFDVKWVGETYDYFIQASPGPITYYESINGGMGQLLAAGIDVEFKFDGDVEYAYHVLERDADGNVTKWGSKIYADFYYPTTLFQTQSIVTLNNANAFNYTITETDREALIYLDSIRVNGKNSLINKWINDETVTDKAAGEALWNTYNLDAIVKDYYDGTFSGSYDASVKALALYVWSEGNYALMKEWAIEGLDGMSTAMWNSYEMDKVIRGDIANPSANQEDLANKVNTLYTKNWALYQMDDIRAGIFHNTDDRTAKDIKAQEYLEMLETEGKAKLMATWDDFFSSVTPPAGYEGDVSEWRYNYLWEYYEMDDVKNGIFHGEHKDHTATIDKYIALMDDGTASPERQGCVAVTRELAEILDTLVSRELFENVHNGWLKFCFYYDYLGA